MKVDAAIAFDGRVSEFIRRCEEADHLYDGISVGESNRDPFLPLVMAAEHTTAVRLETGVAIGFARTPMLLAQVSYDLHQYSAGRFSLGLGTQVKPHIERRFSMPWSAPAARMREMVLAIRAIWDCWHTGAELDFRGEFYTHTLMIPFFDPGPNPFGLPRVALAAVGARMTEVAGEVADSLLLHPFMTQRYLHDVTLPALERGLAHASRTRTDIELSAPIFVVTGTTASELAAADRYARDRIAFYGSTPAYRGVFDVHGWGDAHEELNRLSKRGEWAAMKNVINDEILDAFAIVADPPDVATAVIERFGDVYDRVNYYSASTTFADLVTPALQAHQRTDQPVTDAR